MDIALNGQAAFDIEDKIKTAVNFFKLSKLENALSDMLENLPENPSLDYIGELNKNDVMH